MVIEAIGNVASADSPQWYPGSPWMSAG